jgi:hypothetical protein
MPSTRRVGPALGAAFIILAGLQSGCSSLPWGGDDTGQPAADGGAKQIEVRSDPAGAEVLANGRSVGVTPLTLAPANVWDTGFVSARDYGINYQYTGTITLRMPGCKDFTTNVDDYLLSRDIAVKLECGPDYQPLSTPGPARTQPQPGQAPATAVDYETSEEIMARRLRRLDGLHQRGLITDEEYRQVRRRILGEL